MTIRAMTATQDAIEAIGGSGQATCSCHSILRETLYTSATIQAGVMPALALGYVVQRTDSTIRRSHVAAQLLACHYSKVVFSQ